MMMLVLRNWIFILFVRGFASGDFSLLSSNLKLLPQNECLLKKCLSNLKSCFNGIALHATECMKNDPSTSQLQSSTESTATAKPANSSKLFHQNFKFQKEKLYT